MELKFGFLHEDKKLTWSVGVIEPLPEYENTSDKNTHSTRAS